MVNYRINENAKADLQWIYRRGVLEFGEAQADRYFNAFFERFDELAEQPLQYQAVDDIREGYRRSVCGGRHHLLPISHLNPLWSLRGQSVAKYTTE